MAVGLAPSQANTLLNVYRNNAAAGLSVFIKLHVGDPGGAGTANPSVVTTRNAVTFNAPSGGSMTLGSLAGYSMTAAESISHVSLWDASSAGGFVQSAALSSPVPVINGSVLLFSTVTLAYAPIAA